jgi:hypothetical protein
VLRIESELVMRDIDEAVARIRAEIEALRATADC